MDLTEHVQTISLRRKNVVELAWSPDGTMIAASYKDKVVRVWAQRGSNWELKKEFTGHLSWVHAVAWSPDGKRLASAAEDRTVRIWDVASESAPTVLWHTPNAKLQFVSWSSNGNELALCQGEAGIADIWELSPVVALKYQLTVGLLLFHPKLSTRSAGIAPQNVSFSDSAQPFHRKEYLNEAPRSLAWAPDSRVGTRLAVGMGTGEIQVLDLPLPWDPEDGIKKYLLQGHTQAVTTLSFSFDGALLASAAPNEHIRLWRTDRWESLGNLPGRTPRYFPYGLHFHPSKHLVAHVAEEGAAIHISRVAANRLDTFESAEETSHYTNAKIVLVGDTGVGKTGLGLVLSGEDFRPTDSTHGRNVWPLSDIQHQRPDGTRERRETILWDLAGQPTYRLIHQLSLGETAVALVLFDSRSEIDPLAGVRHWSRALRNAQRFNPGVKLKTFLVASRIDRGGSAISVATADQVLKELGFDAYFEVSAKEGTGVQRLADAIRSAIDWNSLPSVSSNRTFEEIRHFLLAQRQLGVLLATEDQVFATFVSSTRTLVPGDDPEIRERFRAGVSLMQSRGLIRRLSFAGMILLKPETLDAYAAAIVTAARDEPHGLGYILEESVRQAGFPIPAEDRPRDPHQEHILLIATVEELIRHEIALREPSEEGHQLVFPSQFQRNWTEAPNPAGKSLLIRFQGPAMNIYSTLAVRLARSGFFIQDEFWKNAVRYRAKSGGKCGIYLQSTDEGSAELGIFFEGVSPETRAHFEDYVEVHLRRKALPDSVVVRRVVSCQKCSTLISDEQAAARRQRGFAFIQCNVCDTRISLDAPHAAASMVNEIDQAAEAERRKQENLSKVQGKQASGEFDIFLCHNSADKEHVIRIGEKLKERGYLPWLDVWNLRPGIPWQEVLEQNIARVKSAAVLVGPNGEGPWANMELRAFISEYVNRKCPVIPVILENVTTVPKLPLFLKGMTWVDFRVSDPDPVDRLIFGITGSNPDTEGSEG